jgi:hypothetical protein
MDISMKMTVKPRSHPSAAGLTFGAYAASPRMSPTSAPLVLIDRPHTRMTPSSRRTRLSELSRYLHCSVIGTCLSTVELRHILAKAGFVTDGVCDHDLHGTGVTVAGQQDIGSKLLNKALDKRHRQAIGRFAKAKSADDVVALWSEALKTGDIPGAYWAALTHAETTDALVRQMFGEIHMLSHLVGAANRADIQRLNALESENAELREKLSRQEAQLRDGITARDAKIRDLNALLSRRIADDVASDQSDAAPDEHVALTRLVADLEQRLGAESRRRTSVEARLARLVEQAKSAQEARAAAEAREVALRHELEMLEARIAPPADRGDVAQPLSNLSGSTILYVGGRQQQHSHLRDIGSELGIEVMFHDGGIEDRQGLLAGMVSRADVVLFPVDFVSHEAMSHVKRLCRNATKPYLPLRSAGISSFLSALDRVASLEGRHGEVQSALA